MSSPTVSVIIPTFNRRELVQLAIDSVLSQTFQDYELIVVDDGSTDGTGQALNRYGPRIRYVYQDNAGESIARQRGVELSSGKYIAFLDSDDIWLPEKLEWQMRSYDRYPDTGFVYCWAYVINENGDRFTSAPLGYGQLADHRSLEKLLENNFIVSGSSLLVHRSAYEAVQGYCSDIQFGEDWDFCLRLASQYKFTCVEWPLIEYRLHTRGWLQKRDNLERVLDDHLRIIDNFIQYLSAPTDELIRSAKNSKANRYARVAFEHLAYGQTSEGCERLETACLLAPGAWANGDLFAQRAAEFATLLTYNGDEETALAFIERTAASLPEPLLNAGVTRSRMFAQTHKVLADYFGLQGNSGAVRRNALRAIRYDPQWLLHRGLRSLLLRSLVGAIQIDPGWTSNPADPPDIHLIDIRVISDSASGRDKAPNDIWSVTHAPAEQDNA